VPPWRLPAGSEARRAAGPRAAAYPPGHPARPASGRRHHADRAAGRRSPAARAHPSAGPGGV